MCSPREKNLITKNDKPIVEATWKKLQSSSLSHDDIKKSLSYEHLVPLKKYFVDPFIKMANDGELTFYEVKERMNKLYATALFTKEETAKLNKGFKNNMPKGWDEKDI